MAPRNSGPIRSSASTARPNRPSSSGSSGADRTCRVSAKAYVRSWRAPSWRSRAILLRSASLISRSASSVFLRSVTSLTTTHTISLVPKWIMLAPISTSTNEPSFLRYFLSPGVGHEVVYPHLPHLLRGESQHLFERRVSLHDASVLGVQNVDALGGLLDHRPVALPALREILLSPLSLDALGDHVGHGSECLDCVPCEFLAREQSHHAHHPALDDEGITGEGHHAFPPRPFLVVD